ncbi:unnamed protein product, partial [Owenia fusiformis]
PFPPAIHERISQSKTRRPRDISFILKSLQYMLKKKLKIDSQVFLQDKTNPFITHFNYLLQFKASIIFDKSFTIHAFNCNIIEYSVTLLFSFDFVSPLITTFSQSLVAHTHQFAQNPCNRPPIVTNK